MRTIDWEAIEREYRAGQLSVREIARQYEVTEGAIRKRAKADSWTRALAERVKAAVREKLVRDGTRDQHASDAEIVEHSALRGLEVVVSHRGDLKQLHGLKRVLADRLAIVLEGGDPMGLCLGERESPGDLLEKLSRVTSRLIPLERQAFNLDANPDGAAPIQVTIQGDDKGLL